MDAFAAARPESPSPKRRGRGVARKCERLCCSIFTYFPLAFVYGLTTWAVWVEARIGMQKSDIGWIGSTTSAVGIILYLMANISYTVGVFTDPGSPLSDRRGRSRTTRHAYSHLPTTEVPQYSLTVSSTGGTRYCKKCQCPKPDRTHHCSSCKRCVLKMDHHCPWLATCVGFYNYKPFLLFLIYTSLFCWVCFTVSATWVWLKVLNGTQFVETEMPINVVLLAVISGIIGLVLTGFTIWHISLAFRGLTTIECLEKTRYLAPVRKTFDRHRHEGQWRGPAFRDNAPDGTLRHTLEGYGQQLLDMHANAIPGVTRAEEGEERPSPIARHREAYFEPQITENVSHGQSPPYNSPAHQSLYHSYEEMERARERDRYQEYLAETQSEKLPNAFDLGWRRNLRHLLGENPLLWFLPICNTTGDGWHWEPSRKWIEAKQEIDRQRYEQWAHTQHPGPGQPVQYEGGWYPGNQSWQQPRADAPGAPESNGTTQRPPTGVSLKTLPPKSPRTPQQALDDDASSDRYSTSSDETVLNHGRSPDAPARSRSSRILDITGHRSSQDEWRDWD